MNIPLTRIKYLAGDQPTAVYELRDLARQYLSIQADLAAARNAYEMQRQDCINLTEKVIPNIRQDLAAALARIAELESLYKAGCATWTPVLNVIQERAERAEAERNALQARVDALMQEYCPDEMTPAQRAAWAAHQQPVALNVQAAIDATLKEQPK